MSNNEQTKPETKPQTKPELPFFAQPSDKPLVTRSGIRAGIERARKDP